MSTLAMSTALPCNADGHCMKCKRYAEDADTLLCDTCDSPWHMPCLVPPLTRVPAGNWTCPDCNLPEDAAAATVTSECAEGAAFLKPQENQVVALIRAVQRDSTLTEEEKAKKRQQIMNGHFGQRLDAQDDECSESAKRSSTDGKASPLDAIHDDLKCVVCFNLLEKPISMSCGHNSCLKCFQRWTNQKSTCPQCRTRIEPGIISQPRINSVLVAAIRLSKSSSDWSKPFKPNCHPMANESRPDHAFTTSRAVKTGKANACSGRIKVTIPHDHFGPITSEYDSRGTGVLVGETWQDRLECRQWGAHFPHVAGIAGQSSHGAQSVALSGGYVDDEDNGDWFLYTGSGGRDLSGNKRINKVHSFDQVFEKANQALKISCLKGYPVRVIRSHKEKRSSYAPHSGVRYDGIYRIEKCWRKIGTVGHYVCRYLFIRCDNSPAPWSSEECGDRPRDIPEVIELKNAKDITIRNSKPAWDWIEDRQEWGWVVDPPQSKISGIPGQLSNKKMRKSSTQQGKLPKEFQCTLCKGDLSEPVSTPCGHNFCKTCLLNMFIHLPSVRNRTFSETGRILRNQKIVKRCPYSQCNVDISDSLSNLKVNLEMTEIIKKLKEKIEEREEEEKKVNCENDEPPNGTNDWIKFEKFKEVNDRKKNDCDMITLNESKSDEKAYLIEDDEDMDETEMTGEKSEGMNKKNSSSKVISIIGKDKKTKNGGTIENKKGNERKRRRDSKYVSLKKQRNIIKVCSDDDDDDDDDGDDDDYINDNSDEDQCMTQDEGENFDNKGFAIREKNTPLRRSIRVRNKHKSKK